ncbi:MAG: hypothetical protein WCK76_09870 [Elusimicrobiota bacterium]
MWFAAAAIFLLAAAPARAIMNGVDQDILPVTAIFNSSVTITDGGGLLVTYGVSAATAVFTAVNASLPGVTISSGLIVSNGNVGIGAASPAAKLDVNGTIKIAGGSPGLNKVLTSDAAGLASWQTPATSGGDVYLASTQTFTGLNTFRSTTAFTAQNAVLPGVTVSSGLVVAGGFVGIGTTTSGGYALNVIGNTRISNSAAKFILADTDTPFLSLGLVSEVGGQLIDYGANYNQMGTRNAAYPGGFFRIDLRDAYAAEFFNIKYVPAGGAEQTIYNVARTGDTQIAGNIATPYGITASTIILTNGITASSATLGSSGQFRVATTGNVTMADGTLLDLSAINNSATTEGLKLPQAADVSAGTAEGQVAWDSDGDLMQVGTGAGIKTIGIPNNIQAFPTNGTWTKPAGVSTVYVQVWGAGGGGGTGGGNASDGGGGGGGYSAGLVQVTANVTVTVGTGGTANGGTGGDSSFAGAVTLTGGGGTGTTGATGGAGGTASGGTINMPGQKGGDGLAADGARSGDGGASPFGGAGGKGKGGGNAGGGTGLNGEVGLEPGGGGAGGAESNGTGAAGADGLVIVMY